MARAAVRARRSGTGHGMSYVLRLWSLPGKLPYATRDTAVQAAALTAAGGQLELGDYLKSADFDARDGDGEAEFTSDIATALRFPSATEALEFWRTQSRLRPRRSTDGKPNRFLTAFNMTVEEADDGHA